MFSAKRKNDAVMSVYQDNDNAQLLIREANAAALNLIDFQENEILGQSFLKILPDNIKDIIESYIEYNKDGFNDLSTILHKVPNFSIMSKDKRKIPIELKIFYTVSDSTNPCFELLMRDIRLKEQIEKARTILKNSRQAYMDEETGILSRDAIMKDLDIIIKYVAIHSIDTIFAIMKIDNFFTNVATQGPNANRALIRNISERFHASARQEDVIGYLGEGTIGIILFNCDTDDAQKVLGRISTKITDSSDLADDTLKDLNIKMIYTNIQPKDNSTELLVYLNEHYNKVQKNKKDKIFFAKK